MYISKTILLKQQNAIVICALNIQFYSLQPVEVNEWKSVYDMVSFYT